MKFGRELRYRKFRFQGDASRLRRTLEAFNAVANERLAPYLNMMTGDWLLPKS